jgi:hypothetical protein
MTRRIRDAVDANVPAGATLAVISKGDDGLLRMGTRTAWHFPRDEAGDYVGYHPASGSEAVATLESVRAQGAGFLVVPRTAFWWLEHYGELARHLEERCRLVSRDEDCAIYGLLPAPVVDAGVGVLEVAGG